MRLELYCFFARIQRFLSSCSSCLLIAIKEADVSFSLSSTPSKKIKPDLFTRCDYIQIPSYRWLVAKFRRLASLRSPWGQTISPPPPSLKGSEFSVPVFSSEGGESDYVEPKSLLSVFDEHKMELFEYSTLILLSVKIKKKNNKN